MEGRALQDRLCAVIHPILSLAQRRDCTRTHNTAWQCLDMCFNVVKKTTPWPSAWILNVKSRGDCVMRANARSRFISSRPPSPLTKRRSETDCYYGNIMQSHLASSAGTWRGGGETVDNHRWTYRKDWFTQSVQSCFCTSPPEAWLQVDYIFFI